MLVMLSMILTASVLFPDMGEGAIFGVLGGGSAMALLVAGVLWALGRKRGKVEEPIDRSQQDTWQMPPLAQLPPGRLSLSNKVWMVVLRGYLFLGAGLVLVRIAQLAMAGKG